MPRRDKVRKAAGTWRGIIMGLKPLFKPLHSHPIDVSDGNPLFTRGTFGLMEHPRFISPHGLRGLGAV